MTIRAERSDMQILNGKLISTIRSKFSAQLFSSCGLRFGICRCKLLLQFPGLFLPDNLFLSGTTSSGFISVPYRHAQLLIHMSQVAHSAQNIGLEIHKPANVAIQPANRQEYSTECRSNPICSQEGVQSEVRVKAL